ncbi:MAG: LamG-like jellyroll fold domain-containing protein [Candidatus Binatia bacterium]
MNNRQRLNRLVWGWTMTLCFVLTSYIPAVAQTCVAPPAGMIAWWPFDESSGTTAEDIAGNNIAVHVNGPIPTPGMVGNALRLDGVNDFAAAPDSDLWAFGANDFTLEFWANFDAPGGGSVGHPGDVFLSNDAGPGGQNKWFFALGGGVLNFHINGSSGSRFFPQVPFSPTVGQWYHLAITRNGDTYTIFINGTPSGSATDTRIIPNANAPLTIGQANEPFGGFMNGLLDEVTIYDRALSPEELAAIVNAGSAGKCKSLAIDTAALSAVKLGDFFSQEFSVVFGTPPLSWAIVNGTLPPGVTLSPEGVLSGTPTELGEFTFTVQVMDGNGTFTEEEFTLKVLETLPLPDIRIHKTGTVAVPGRELDYFVLVENQTDVVANNVIVSEFLEPWFTFISASPSPDTIIEGPDAFPEDTSVEATYGMFLKWRISKLGPREVALITYRASLDRRVPLGTTVTGGICLTPEEADQCSGDLITVYLDAVTACAVFIARGTPQLCPAYPFGASLVYFKCMADKGFDCSTDEKNANAPIDPNEKLVVAKRFIQPDQLLVYPIHFENIGDIEARDIFISDVLDPNLDPSTLKLLTPSGGSFDDTTRTIRWELRNRNLPPGESDNVLLAIRPLPGLPSGTEIRNRAEIQFEVFEPLVTAEVVNIIDTTSPRCDVNPLPAHTSTPDFQISWSGTDEVGEIESYSVFVSVDGGSFTPLLQDTKDTSTTFRGGVEKTYGFFCTAVDTAGNAEVQDSVAEATTQIVATNRPPMARCQDVTVPTEPGSCTATVSVDAGSFDPDRDPLSILQSPAGPYHVGTTDVTLTVTDEKGASNSCTAIVTVRDTVAPVISTVSAEPNVLWPPNHKMVPVTLHATASDNCNEAPVCKVIAVSSNDPVQRRGRGNTTPDWELLGDLTVHLRAEHSERGSGRTYTVMVECTDASLNSAKASTTVIVPHDERKSPHEQQPPARTKRQGAHEG